MRKKSRTKKSAPRKVTFGDVCDAMKQAANNAGANPVKAEFTFESPSGRKRGTVSFEFAGPSEIKRQRRSK